MPTTELATASAPKRATRKPRLGRTDRTLIAMLTENTGRHMLDNGGAQAEPVGRCAYGRAWERNQGRDFKAAPAVVLVWNEHEMSVTLDVFHWLSERVNYEPARTAAFTRFAKRPENSDKHWLELMEDWAAKHCDADGAHVTNTYNGEDLLSQTLQYVLWRDKADDEEYILLQIHGGCDVRGGYTAPRIFRCSSSDYSIYDNAHASIAEDVPYNDGQDELPGIKTEHWQPVWDTQDSCNWAREGAYGYSVPPQLETYEISRDPADRGNGKVYVDADGVAYGPIKGGRLIAHSSC